MSEEVKRVLSLPVRNHSKKGVGDSVQEPASDEEQTPLANPSCALHRMWMAGVRPWPEKE